MPNYSNGPNAALRPSFQYSAGLARHFDEDRDRAVTAPKDDNLRNFSMKKSILLSITILVVSISASAQFSKGTIFVGPTIGTNSYQSASDNLDYYSGANNNRSISSKTYTLTIGPQVGVFVTDHLILGGSVNVGETDKKTNTSTLLANATTTQTSAKTNTTTFPAGPFLRYYFFETLSKNMFYGQVNGNLGTGSGSSSGNGNNNATSTYQSIGTVNEIFTWTAGGSIGFTHFFSDFVGMDVAVGYSFNSTTNNNVNTTNTKSNTTEIITSTPNNYKETDHTNGITLGLGFHWFFKKEG
jgi:hypothetical protein